MAEYAKVFDPRPYHQAGQHNLLEMSASLSDAAAKVLPKLDQDQRARFQERVEKYTNWDELPRDLLLQILTNL